MLQTQEGKILKHNLLQHPNQSFSFETDGNHYQVTLKDCDGFMSIDIDCNNQNFISGQRLLPNSIVLPYRHLEQGNFLFVTANQEFADWHKFEVSQFLYFITEDELTEMREHNGRI